jgi:tRNA pseudouridine55 synthase
VSDINGIINIIKPPGISSYGIVQWVKRFFGVKKSGHTGTLDPAAAGVLPVCLGKATKVIPYITEEEKEYIAEITLGISTDTLDAQGKIVDTNSYWKYLKSDRIYEVFNNFKGEIEQIPPMYSAIKHKGKKLYEYARNGIQIKRDARKIIIKELYMLNIDLPKIRFQVLCSKGTYIRVLAADIGKSLGVGAHLSFLVRKKSGPFTIEDAYITEEIEELYNNNNNSFLLPMDYPLDYQIVSLKEEASKKAYNGVSLTENDLIKKYEGLKIGNRVMVYDIHGSFISINDIIYNDDMELMFKPVKVFYS